MYPALQGNSTNLQGGTSGIALGGNLQGSSPTLQFAGNNPQKTASIANIQPAVGGGNTLNPNIASLQNTVNQTTQWLNNSQNDTAAIERQILALEQQQANHPLAPTLDYNAIQANAKAAATNNVNPLYTQKLNEYLQNEAAQTQQQQEQQQLAVQQAQAALENTQAENTQASAYTQAKTGQNIAQTNTQEANYLQNQGTSFDIKQRAMQQSLGASGMDASGAGQQQLWQAENLRNVEEAQQQGTFQYNRNMANLEANNTFAQLAQSNAYATTQEGQSEAKSKLDLNSYLRQAAYDEQKFREQNEQQRQADILSQTAQSSAQKVAQFVNQYKNNAPLYNAALQAYAPLMRA